MRNLIQLILNKLGFQIIKLDKNQSKTHFGLNNQINREIWLENILKSIPSGQCILDAGAGELQYKKFCSHLKYVSQDFGQYNGTGNNAAIQTQSWNNSKLDIISDITNIPIPDNSFDAIMCIEVFEHLPAPIDAIKEFSRLLKKNGTLLITAPFCSLTHFAPYHFYSGFNKYFFEKHLSDYGFEINELIPNGSFFEYMAQEIQLRIPNSYSTETIMQIELQAINTVIHILEKMSKTDKGSSEMLCFGYQVKARKR